MNVPLEPQTSDYGEAFECWFINECHRLNQYRELDYAFSYLRTKDDREIDLIIDRPGKEPVLVEVKSATSIDERHIKSLLAFHDDFPGADLICACLAGEARKIGQVFILPWGQALERLFP